MTDLRRQPADLSSESIVPLQVDAASGPEQVLPRRHETRSRSLGAERLARSPPPPDVLDLTWL